MTMRTIDMSPLYRATVGFDHFADLVDRVMRADAGNQPSYPPFNIEKTDDDAYRISIAAAGFGEDDLNIEVRENALIVTAKKPEDDAERTYLHRGIATRAFERRFHLADHVHVTGASLVNGMLDIELKREVPEALKPRRIAIGNSTPAVEGTVAA
jgi:molecular chaperone IbpA